MTKYEPSCRLMVLLSLVTRGVASSAGSVDNGWGYLSRGLQFSETSFLVERIGSPEILPSDGPIAKLRMSYNMSDEYSGVIVAKDDCSSDLPEGIMDISLVSVVYEGNETFSNITIDVCLNTSAITGSEIYRELDNGDGNFAFCVRGEQYVLPDDNITNSMTVNFEETVYNLTIDTDGDFSFDVDLARESAEEVDETMSFDEYLKVVQCDENRVELTSPEALTQGSILNVCATSRDATIVLVDQIMELKLTQGGGGNEFIAIDNGAETLKSLVISDGTDCVDGVCMVQMILVSKFFAEDEPEDLTLTGSVKLSIPAPSATRRYLEVSRSERGLEATESGFEMNIEVKSEPQTDSSSVPKNMASAYILAGLFYLVMG
eukprot:CAMPEP_0172493940 /NCGR_PEP_ID=MMETSP1066-20121228/32826_1 /TAXON_ID=671091 /ORGANISM="Coscinodiscus wailesii, Strain CCMP2513" /LENGTH=375 /DNA_ID=CAMNT_0013264441 /DNA_START=45 /DNA_END=1172 /DNA_ORIENTATION=-